MSLFHHKHKESEFLPVNEKNLPHLPVTIEKLGYDRAKVTTGIVHFGLGNFYRSHLAAYVNRLLEKPGHESWGITGVEVIDSPVNKKKAQSYQAQDNLFTLTRFKEDGVRKTAVLGSVIGHLYAPEDPQGVLAHLTDPATKIVSLTITEGGYNIDGATKKFRLHQPDIVHDLQNPAAPKTVFGFVVEALDRRRKAGLEPFTIMSCDNVLHNGRTARKAFVSFAKARDPELASWIDEKVSFPNSMVDRITPALDEKRIADINLLNEVSDQIPVISEEFTQWVLEDDFSNGRPDWEAVGVQMIAGGAVSSQGMQGNLQNIELFEQVKLRVLNESHSIIGMIGMLENIEFIDETLKRQEVREFLAEFLKTDVLPTLQAPYQMNLQKYAEQTISRFTNAALQDTCARIASDSVSKVQVFWSETIKNALTGKVEGTKNVAFLCALLLEYLRGRRLNNEPYTLKEPALSPEQLEIAQNGADTAGFSLPCFDPVRGYFTPEFEERVIALRGAILNKGVFSALFTSY